MKRIFLVLAIAISRGACAQLRQVQQVVTGATATVNNPVTRDMVYDVENGAIIAASALVAYRNTCIARIIAPSCRTVIQTLQVYTKKVAVGLPRLRAFVRDNDQVNAVLAYNAIQGLLSDFRTVAIANNVPVTQ